ncbi:MAG: TolC family protein [Bacteroidales bacterium]|nr:TolC family protein [Bacteroidales bacterium]
MSSIRIFSTLILAFLLGGQVIAQEAWTLTGCIKYALENNIQLKQQSLSVDMAKNNLGQSKLSILPTLNSGLSESFRFGRSVDPLTYQFTTENSTGASVYISTEIDLFKGLQNLNTIQKNQIDLKKNLADLEKAKNDLSLNIARMYLQILFNEELHDITVQQLDITKQQANRTRIMVEAGSLPKGDYLDIQAQMANEELSEVNARNQLTLSYLDLAQLLDLKSPENFRVQRPTFESFQVLDNLGSSDEVYQSAVSTLPQVKSAELGLQSLEKDLRIAVGRQVPSLSLSSSYGTGYSDRLKDFITGSTMNLRDQLDYTSQTSVGFNLNIPIFNGWSTRTSIKNARLSLLNGKYQLETVQNQLLKEIQQAFADATASLEKFRATAKSVSSLEEAFRYAEQKLNVGLLTSLDYNVAKNNLTKARSELLQAKYNYIFNTRILDFYRGIPIDLK